MQGARGRLEQLAIPLSQRGGDLSGGQAAQVALSIALGTGASVLLLDEPLASLDPLARHEFLNMLQGAVGQQGRTALLSSHIVSDVEAICEEIVVLGQGVATLQAPIREALAGHRLVEGEAGGEAGVVAVFARPGGGLATLVRAEDPSLAVPTLEELVMGYLAAARQAGAPRSEAA